MKNIDETKEPLLIEINNLRLELAKATEKVARYEEIMDTLQDVVFEIDLNGNLLYGNKRGFSFWGFTEEEYIKGINIFQVVPPEELPRMKNNFAELFRTKKSNTNEYIVMRTNGKKFPVSIHITPIFENGIPTKARGIVIDISRRKKFEDKLRYLSLHDPLTGLYNRAYFESETSKAVKNKTSIGLIICDLDGLKLINDTLGHKAGDSALISLAKIFKRVFRKDDIVARIGGDEFAILLLNCNEKEVIKVRKRIITAVEKHNTRTPARPLTVSIGYSVQEKPPFNIETLFKEADDYLYREKLFHTQSNKSSIVQTLMKALEARDFITEGHAERLQKLVMLMNTYCESINCHENKLRPLAQFHDIGKVGVPDRILFKEGPLTESETDEMRRHCDLGHRIAMADPELSHIADLILKHHEWWNGQGYPLGLKGEEIPLECRILAIADAYDAMTSGRPYRQALSHAEAIKELKRNAGTQFDPHLVNQFIEVLEKTDIH